MACAQPEKRAGTCRIYSLRREASMKYRPGVLPCWLCCKWSCLLLTHACCVPMRRWSDPGKASRPYRRQQAHGLDSLFQDMLSQLAVVEAPPAQPKVYARAPTLVARLRAASRAVPLAARLRTLSRAASPRRRQSVVSAQGSQVFSGSGSFSAMGVLSGSGSNPGLQTTLLVPARPAGASLQAQLQARTQARAKRIAQCSEAESGTAQYAGGRGAQDQRMTAEAGAHAGGRTADDHESLSSGDDKLRTGVDMLKAGHAGLQHLVPQPRAPAPDQLQAELLRMFRNRIAAAELQTGAPQQAGSALDTATQHASPAVRYPKHRDTSPQGASGPLGRALHAAVPSMQERIQGERRAKAGPAGQDLVEHSGHVPGAQPGPGTPSLQAQLQANFQAREERARSARLKGERMTSASTPAPSTSSGREIASASGHSGAAHASQDKLQASLRQPIERAKQRGAAPVLSAGGSTRPGTGRRGADTTDPMQGDGHLEAQPEQPTRQGFVGIQQATKAQHVAIGRPARRA